MLIVIGAPQQTIDDLNADTDAAVEAHAVHAGRIQSQLDELDAELLQHVLAGTSTTRRELERRQSLLAELDAINSELEHQCQRNQREIDLINDPTSVY